MRDAGRRETHEGRTKKEEGRKIKNGRRENESEAKGTIGILPIWRLRETAFPSILSRVTFFSKNSK